MYPTIYILQSENGSNTRKPHWTSLAAFSSIKNAQRRAELDAGEPLSWHKPIAQPGDDNRIVSATNWELVLGPTTMRVRIMKLEVDKYLPD